MVQNYVNLQITFLTLRHIYDYFYVLKNRQLFLTFLLCYVDSLSWDNIILIYQSNILDIFPKNGLAAGRTILCASICQ